MRAIQSGGYVHAIKLDRQFSAVSPSLASGTSASGIASQIVSSGRDTIDRKSIIQDLFATLPPAERTLLEDEIGKVATGVRANASSSLTPRQGISAAKRPPMAELGLSASWEDVGTGTGSPAPSTSVSVSSSAIGAAFAGKATPVPVSTVRINQSSASPFASRAPRPQPASGHKAPPTPKFTAFGSPIPPTTGVSTGRGVITGRGKTLFSTSAVGGPSGAVKLPARVSLFEIAGSAKTAPNAFYKPPSAPMARASLDVGSALASSGTAKSAGQGLNTAKQNGKAQGGESDGEDMGSRSDVEIIEEDHCDESGGEEQDEDDAGNFITYDKSGAADLTLYARYADEVMGEDHEAGPELGFSVFSGSRSVVQNGNASGHRKKDTKGHVPYAPPPPRARVSPSGEGDKSLSLSVNSTTTNKARAPPGAFHHEEEDDGDRHDQQENEDDNEQEDKEKGGRASRTAPINSPRPSTFTRMQAQTPSRPSARSQPQRNLKSTTTTTSDTNRLLMRTSSSRLSLSQTIPGSLMDEDNDEHGQDDADHTDAHGDEDTEMDEQEEEDDAIAPLPSRSSRRTRNSGYVGTFTTTSTKSKASAKTTTPARTAATTTAAKGKTKARPSEAKTPPRRSSRLSTASSVSSDHSETASPTKKGRKSTGSKASAAGSGNGMVATRSSARRKR